VKNEKRKAKNEKRKAKNEKRKAKNEKLKVKNEKLKVKNEKRKWKMNNEKWKTKESFVLLIALLHGLTALLRSSWAQVVLWYISRRKEKKWKEE
jgi:hypothetical protein